MKDNPSNWALKISKLDSNLLHRHNKNEILIRFGKIQMISCQKLFCICVIGAVLVDGEEKSVYKEESEELLEIREVLLRTNTLPPNDKLPVAIEVRLQHKRLTNRLQSMKLQIRIVESCVNLG